MLMPVTLVPLEDTTRLAWNWFEFWAGGDGNVVTKAKMEAKSVTVRDSRKIVATTSETPRRLRANFRRALDARNGDPRAIRRERIRFSPRAGADRIFKARGRYLFVVVAEGASRVQESIDPERTGVSRVPRAGKREGEGGPGRNLEQWLD